MRLDKFLKVSRLIKRRTVAKEVADQGRILINGRTAKSSSNVSPGDELAIRFGQKRLVVTVESTRDSSKKHDAASMYKIVSEEPVKNE
ncbi:MAG TPA: RNA-binding S4 domain-containing protein [Bacillales bacterium]|nr:RNA-binding S4 domain-containing protein [Bacillales bacterium]